MSEIKTRALRVLVVDDQEGVRMVVADTVRFAGHEVIAVGEDGQQAIELAREHRPDLVIMDIQMPRLNGAGAMEVILKEGTAERVVLMSGEWRSAGLTTEDLKRLGASAFLEKPFSVTQLFDLLDQYARELTAA
jgi:CheY-like chemotaxis protein